MAYNPKHTFRIIGDMFISITCSNEETDYRKSDFGFLSCHCSLPISTNFNQVNLLNNIITDSQHTHIYTNIYIYTLIVTLTLRLYYLSLISYHI